MKQLHLLDDPVEVVDVPVSHAGLSRSSDPDTSRAAAQWISKGVENAVRGAFRRGPANGYTDDELCVRLYDLHAPTVKSARSRLSKRGLLVDSGERRLSDRGRAQIVWRLA